MSSSGKNDSDASVESLIALFPIAFPTPIPSTHPNLISSKDLQREDDLLRNATSFRQWWTTIQSTRDDLSVLQRASTSQHTEGVNAALGQLGSPVAKSALERLTYLYESGLAQFPTSYKLWKSYLHSRMGFVLGRAIKPKRAGGRKKFPDMREALEDEDLDALTYENPLDGVVGWTEWRALVGVFERALMWLPNVSCSSKSLFVCTNIPHFKRCPEFG